MEWDIPGSPHPPAEYIMKSAYPLIAKPTAAAPTTASVARSLIQTKKAEVSLLGDPLEREADAVADRVIGTPEPAPTHRTGAGQKSSRAPPAAVGTTHDVVSSQGRALDPSTRVFFESRFQHDFSRVRIHDSSTAAEAARCIGARAFTTGWDISFASGQYSPATNSGRRLLAHELTHVLQQNGSGRNIGRAYGTRIQRQAVPPEQFAKLIEEIDVQLAKQNLSAAERIKLMQTRQEYWEDLEAQDPQGRYIPRLVNQISPRFQTRPATPTSTPPKTLDQTEATHRPVPTTGNFGAPRASAGAKLAEEARKGLVPPPSTAYVDTNRQPRNAQESAKRAEEAAIGKLLNEMAVSNDLDEFRRVEGRAPVQGDSADYALIAKDGTSTRADLYTPSGDGLPEDASKHAIDSKSGQAEVVVLHLTGIKKPSEYAHRFADALIATPNHGLKRLYVFSDQKFILKRRLIVDANALEATRKKVADRMDAQRKTRLLKQRDAETPKSEPKNVEARKVSPQEIARLSSYLAASEIKARFGDEGAKSAEASEGRVRKSFSSDPAGHTFESPSHTGMSTQGAVEGAAQQIYAAQINSVRDAEQQKAVDALNNLQFQIKALQADGRDVHVTVVAEVPIDFDFFGYVAGMPAADQVVYFTTMYISSAPHAFNPNVQVKPAPYTSIRAMPESESKVMDSLAGHTDRYDDPAWVDAMQEQYEIYGFAGTYKPPRKGFRYEAKSTIFPAAGN
jgi:uncharacterized protein DUF4157